MKQTLTLLALVFVTENRLFKYIPLLAGVGVLGAGTGSEGTGRLLFPFMKLRKSIFVCVKLSLLL